MGTCGRRLGIVIPVSLTATIDKRATPVEAGLTWAVGKRQKMTRSFSGGSGVRDHVDNDPPVRIGIRSDGLAGAEAVIVAAHECPHCVAQAIQTKRSPDTGDQAGAPDATGQA